MKVETIKGTAKETTLNIIPPPYYKTVATRVRIEFGCSNDRVDIEGTCDTLQDLREILREMLTALEHA